MRVNDFDLIAQFYDDLVSWAPYEIWTRDLTKQLRKFGLPDNARILDAACGTGLSTFPMARMGYDVTGIDISPAMLAPAREKAAAEDLRVKFDVGDMRDMNCKEIFKAVISMHSGLDYILELEALQRAFLNTRRLLEPGGLFAFDKCLDEPNFYKEPQRDTRELTNGHAVFYYRWYRKRRIFEQDCYIYYKDETGEKRTVHMTQHMLAVPLPELIEMVESAGFKTLKAPGRFTVADPGMGIFRAI